MKKTLKFLAVAAMVALAGNVMAADLAVPHTFSSGTTIKSSDVNENFTTIYSEVDMLKNIVSAIGKNSQIFNKGLVGYYPFNGNTNDESGNGRHGVPSDISLTSDRYGNDNSAYSFLGTNTSYISISNNPSVFGDMSSLTLSAWIKHLEFTNGSYEAGILSARPESQSDYSSGLVFDIRSGNNTGSGLSLETQRLHNTGYFSSGTVLDLNVWKHVAAVVNYGESIKLYVNGELKNTKTPVSSVVFNDLNNILIGNRYWGGTINAAFKGVIDDVRVYNIALSPLDVNSLYYTEKP